MSPEPREIPFRILVVDDEENIRRSIFRLLSRENYDAVLAASGAEGLDILKSDPDVAVILSDHRMPEMTGVEFLEKAREVAPDAVRVMLTGYSSKDAAVDSINRGGAHRFLEKPWRDNDLLGVVFEGVQRFSMIRENRTLHELVRRQNVELQEWNATLEARVHEQTEGLKKLNTRLERNFHDTIVAFANLLEIREQEEGSHSRDTAALARQLCERLGMSLAETAETVVAARLHDIGKIGLSEALMRKTVDLMTPPEFTAYKDHPVLGETTLDMVEDLRDAGRLIRHHHERWDGSGFPDRLRADAIPRGSRVITLADFIDRFMRSGSKENPISEVLRMIRLRLGRQFDPAFGACLEGLVESVYGERVGQYRIHEVEVHLKDLAPGMVLSRDLRSGTGFLLLSGGIQLSAKNIEAVRRYCRSDPFRTGIFVALPKEGLHKGDE